MIDFTATYNTYASQLVYLAKGIVHVDDVATDIVSDVFCKLLPSIEGFKNSDHVKGHLIVAVKNACLDYCKHVKVRRMKESEIMDTFGADDVVRAEIEWGVMDIIRERIELLPPMQKRIVKLYYMDGYSDKEIADMLGIKNQTVRNAKSNAVYALRLTVFSKKAAL